MVWLRGINIPIQPPWEERVIGRNTLSSMYVLQMGPIWLETLLLSSLWLGMYVFRFDWFAM